MLIDAAFTDRDGNTTQFLPLRNPRRQTKDTSSSRNIDLVMTISIWKGLQEEMAVC